MSKKEDLGKLFESYNITENKVSSVEQTHKRVTFLLDNEVLKRLDVLASNKKRGFKTQVFNTAVEMIVTELEKLEEGE